MRLAPFLAGMVVATTASLAAAPPPGPPALRGMQGVDDDSMTSETYTWHNGTLEARYLALNATLRPGLRRYNVFWSGLEPTPPSATPRACPAGFLAVPASEAERVARGYHLFHCYSTDTLTRFDRVLELDASIGAASAFITYGSPDWAADPACTGFPWPPNPNFRQGCLPWKALDAYEDYILVMAERWSAPWGSGKARLSGICVWNEVVRARPAPPPTPPY